MPDEDILTPEPILTLQKSQGCLHIADMVGMFGIAVFSRIEMIGILWVTRMGTQSVLDRCEGRDVRKGRRGVCWGSGEDRLGRRDV